MSVEHAKPDMVVVRPGATVLESHLAKSSTGQTFRVVTVRQPFGRRDLELHVPVAGDVDLALANALCGDTSPPEPTVQYRVEGGTDFGDMVIEVPVDITEPGAVATFLAERLTAKTRPPIDAEHGFNWQVLLKEDHPGAPDAFASLSIDGEPGVRYPLIEAPRGGAL